VPCERCAMARTAALRLADEISVAGPYFGAASSIPYGVLKCFRRALLNMKQIHVWPNHIRVPHLDLILLRPKEEPVAHSLVALARFGLDTRPENVEVHSGVSAN
jgi:hypothetical protein